MTLEKTEVVPLYAGFWRRAAAAVVDSLLLIVPNIIISYTLGGGILAFAVTIALACLFYAGFHASAKQATPGKMAFGIKVTDLEGERISAARAIGRYFATWISSIILCIGWLMAGFTAKKQALHDMIAGTLVVNGTAEPAEVAAGGGPMPITGGVWAVVALLLFFPFVAGILAAIAIPAYQDYGVRAHVAEVIVLTAPLRTQVGQVLEKRQAVTAGPTDIVSPHLQAVEVTQAGEISTRFVPTVANGGRIVWTPKLEPAGGVTWKCASPDISPKYLPARCRE